MSPYEIHILLWIYASPAKIEDNMQVGRLLDETISKFSENGLIEPSSKSDNGWCCTIKGRVYVDGLCNLPLPVQKWGFPND